MPVTNYDTFNGQIIGENTGGVQTNCMLDALGSVVGTKNSSGVVLNTYRHKLYGGLLAKTGTAADPKFLWNGGSGYRVTQRAHSDLYVRARHFGSAEGLWTSVDPLWPGEGAFGYSSGNPATTSDPTGARPKPKPPGAPVTASVGVNCCVLWPDSCAGLCKCVQAGGCSGGEPGANCVAQISYYTSADLCCDVSGNGKFYTINVQIQIFICHFTDGGETTPFPVATGGWSLVVGKSGKPSKCAGPGC